MAYTHALDFGSVSQQTQVLVKQISNVFNIENCRYKLLFSC